jgi:tetratricopeptide (TPR) repeat protein
MNQTTDRSHAPTGGKAHLRRVALLLALLVLLVAGSHAATARSNDGSGEPAATIYIPVAQNNWRPDSGDGSEGRIYAYSDAAVVQPDFATLPILQSQKPLLCQARDNVTPLTLAQALQNGWNYLAQQVGTGNLDTFRAAEEVATPEGAQAFAMAAMADRRPDGALAGMLRAHELNSQSPIILINAAGMFATLDMPNEALALLDAAAALPEPAQPETPIGIPSSELATNTRGYAMLALGQWAQAETVLRPLVEAGTELSEARMNLSQALLCQDKDDEAVRFYRLGARRMTWDVVEHGEEIEGIRPPVELTLNRTAGKVFTLPPLGVMNTPEQAEAVWEHTNNLIDQSIARGDELNALIEANTDQRHARPLPGPLTMARFNNITITALRAMYEPDIEALYEATAAQEDVLNELNDEHGQEWLDLADDFTDWNEYVAACRDMVRGHLPQWLAEYSEFENLLEEYTLAKYAAMTGAAANLSDFLNHEYVSLSIENEMETDVAWRLHVLNGYAATTWAHWNYCEGVAQSAPEEPSEPTFERADRCPASLTRNKMGITILGMVQLRANCEVFEAEVAGPGLITIFGQVTVDMRNKTSTFFAGGKIQSPPGMVRLGANEGLYISVGENGISDVGLKVSTSVDVGPDQFYGSIDGPGFEFGVAPAMEYLMTPTMP